MRLLLHAFVCLFLFCFILRVRVRNLFAVSYYNLVSYIIFLWIKFHSSWNHIEIYHRDHSVSIMKTKSNYKVNLKSLVTCIPFLFQCFWGADIKFIWKKRESTEWRCYNRYLRECGINQGDVKYTKHAVVTTFFKRAEMDEPQNDQLYQSAGVNTIHVLIIDCQITWSKYPCSPEFSLV